METLLSLVKFIQGNYIDGATAFAYVFAIAKIIQFFDVFAKQVTEATTWTDKDDKWYKKYIHPVTVAISKLMGFFNIIDSKNKDGKKK